MNRSLPFLFLLAAGLTAAFGVDTAPAPARSISYLALGDSHAAGTSLPERESFPFQFSLELEKLGAIVSQPTVIAGEGWSTDDLIKALSQLDSAPDWDLITIQIGANNHFRMTPLEKFEEDIRYILWKSIKLSGGRPERVVIFSIPDWGKTPFGKNLNQDQISLSLKDFNKSIRMMAERAETTFVDITPLSDKAEKNPLLIASDGLHPSGKMIRLWVEEALSEFRADFIPKENF